jgi:hypothetical protein
MSERCPSFGQRSHRGPLLLIRSSYSMARFFLSRRPLLSSEDLLRLRSVLGKDPIGSHYYLHSALNAKTSAVTVSFSLIVMWNVKWTLSSGSCPWPMTMLLVSSDTITGNPSESVVAVLREIVGTLYCPPDTSPVP